MELKTKISKLLCGLCTEHIHLGEQCKQNITKKKSDLPEKIVFRAIK